MSGFELEHSVVDRLLEPLSGVVVPCGPNLEHDPLFMQLEKAASDTPGSQFGEGVPADWRAAHALSLQLFERTRDLRVALPLARASVRLAGYAALPSALRLVRGMLDAWWPHVHPVPEDDDDPTRVNTLAPLYSAGGLIDDMSHCVLYALRDEAHLRVRDLQLAMGAIAARDDELHFTRGQLDLMLADVFSDNAALAHLPNLVVAEVEALIAVLDERGGAPYDGLLLPLLEFSSRIREGVCLAGGRSYAMAMGPAGDDDEGDEGGHRDQHNDGDGFAVPGRGGLVRNRADALRAIDQACEYFERAEPTHPASLFLRRVQRLADHNFLQLMAELAPDALNGVAALVGVDPKDVTFE